jgi:hypothetical protein
MTHYSTGLWASLFLHKRSHGDTGCNFGDPKHDDISTDKDL